MILISSENVLSYMFSLKCVQLSRGPDISPEIFLGFLQTLQMNTRTGEPRSISPYLSVYKSYINLRYVNSAND